MQEARCRSAHTWRPRVGAERRGRAHFPPPRLWEPGAGGGGGPCRPSSTAAARCPETRPPPAAPVPGAASVSAVTSLHPAPKYESAAAPPTPQRAGAGEGRRRGGSEGAGEGDGPSSLPRGQGGSARGRAPPAALGSAGLAGRGGAGRGGARARRQRRSHRPYRAVRQRGAAGAALWGKPRGRASRAPRRPVLLGRKALPGPRLRPTSRAQRSLLV